MSAGGMQPSASRTELLLACPRPFDPETAADPDEPGEAARYGSAFHRVLGECLQSGSKGKKFLEQTAGYAKAVDRAVRAFEVPDTRDELAGHVKGSVKVLRKWLERERLKIVSVESAFAVRPQADGSWSVREIPPHDGDHRYEVEEGEVPCTVDLIAMSSNRRRAVVIDHKTGRGETDDFARPLLVPQMRTLGLIPEGKVQAEIGIFHADRLGLPAVYAEPYEPIDRKNHAMALHRALGQIGSGFLRVGPQCEYCKAKSTCPAKAAELIGEGTAALVDAANALSAGPIDPKELVVVDSALSVEERAGALYDLLKRFRKLEKLASSEIKRLVKEGAVIETREGHVLAIQTYAQETLSKKSVLAALGKIAGEKELQRLREKGAIVEGTRERLIAEK